MADFYFSKILLFKIDGSKDDGKNVTLPPQLPISSTVPVLVAIVLLVLKMAMGISSPFYSGESLFSSENVSQQGKENGIINDEGQKLAPKEAMELEDNVMDLRRAKRG
ncbi:hypothetical protein Adt_11197 [Abeliophyllum distichum]|uniref:Uncharacterized protein n=1 Tax=Abeliophyllum distichum TaxID=126358 RepID=A0ABD1UNU8_9LAMI